MQDEVNSKVVALVISTGKSGMRMSASVLKAALRKYLQEQEKSRNKRQLAKTDPEKYGKRGKQTLESLMKQRQQLANLEITDQNIKSFEKVANKYHVDFALKKDLQAEKPTYVVFFKARDDRVMNQAFKEYAAMGQKLSKKPSVRKLLKKAVEKSKAIISMQDKNRTLEKNRGKEAVR